MQIQYSYKYLHTFVQQYQYRLYAQNPGFEIVREESVKVYLHMYNGNVQQNPLCVESCVTKEFSISPRLSPTMFDPDPNLLLLRAHLPLYSSSSRLCAENPRFEIVQESVKVCTTGMFSRTVNNCVRRVVLHSRLCGTILL